MATPKNAKQETESGGIPKIVPILSALIILFVIIYAGGSYFVFSATTEGDRSFETIPPLANHEDVTFAARAQEYDVHAFFMPRVASDIVLINVPGYNMSRSASYHRRRTEALWDLGYNVLSIDLSDNGGDTVDDGYNSMGDSEQWDVLGAVDYLVQRGFSPVNIGIVADSTGASASLMAAETETCIRALWVESPVTDPWKVITERGYPAVFVPGAKVWASFLTDEDISAVKPLDAAQSLATNEQSVYLVATEANQNVKFHHAEELLAAYQAAGVNITFWDLPDLQHMETFDRFQDEYLSRLDTFFSDTLGKTGPGCAAAA